jgi:benzoyl-CoA reductase/2-hydroxyglutaryl-CoA dehydratase subunit BcrC/BadD/HgdB
LKTTYIKCAFETDLKKAIYDIKNRKPINRKLRLGYIGVPPMTSDIYEFVEMFDANFVYNEVQREFAFPRADKTLNIFEQYYDYTYPYDTEFRIKELQNQIELRKLDGIIHYTQAFCYRAIEDIVLKEKLDIPILNIEGDKLNVLDARTKLRLEAFLDMLLDLKESKK